MAGARLLQVAGLERVLKIASESGIVISSSSPLALYHE